MFIVNRALTVSVSQNGINPSSCTLSLAYKKCSVSPPWPRDPVYWTLHDGIGKGAEKQTKRKITEKTGQCLKMSFLCSSACLGASPVTDRKLGMGLHRTFCPC
jgi:hypothetical protein